MRHKRYALVRLRRGRKRAVLVTSARTLFVDREKVDDALRWAFAQGWKSADIEYLYDDPNERHCTLLVKAPALRARCVQCHRPVEGNGYCEDEHVCGRCGRELFECAALPTPAGAPPASTPEERDRHA